MPAVYKIMDAVRERPVLYDQSKQDFNNIGVKHRTWKEVANVVYGKEDKATVNKVKIQWKSLRDAFVKHQRKLKVATTKIKPYVYEEEMKFILPHILTREREEYEIKREETDIKDVVFNDLQSENEESSRIVNVSGGIVWEDQNHQQIQSICSDGIKETHPVDAFFHGIAQTVKQLKPATVAKLKKAVANIVMDAELEEIQTNMNYS